MAKKTMKKSRIGFLNEGETIRLTWRELVVDSNMFCEEKSTVIREGFVPRKVRVTVTLTVEDVK